MLLIHIKINFMANKVLGMHRLKNKVNRNAFDLSHRHMFTAQVGELLPVFSQWVNPNETFRLGIMVRLVPLHLTLMPLLVFVKIFNTILCLFSLFGNILNSKLTI